VEAGTGLLLLRRSLLPLILIWLEEGVHERFLEKISESAKQAPSSLVIISLVVPLVISILLVLVLRPAWGLLRLILESEPKWS